MSNYFNNPELAEAFIHLKHLPLLNSIHIERAKTAIYNEPDVEKINEFKIRSTNSDRLHWFEQEKFCQDLSKKFGAVEARYSKMNAATYYDWHRDLTRPYCINVSLVQPAHAQTLHRKSISRMLFDIRECRYELLRPTLFNAQILHSVSNPANESRYILSISFPRSTVSWNDAKDWLISYHYTDY
jgi:hypothetical protein